jgi:DNA-binding transcriptional regulator YiaG
MWDKMNIDDIRERININIEKIERLDEKYRKAYMPKAPSGECSYFDYDSIHGSKKEHNLEEYYNERLRLQTLIELDQELINSKGQDNDDKLYISLLKTNVQKVRYLRIVRGYTQAKVAEILNISERTVRRIELESK